MSDSTHWQASLNEHRAAWIIACCCIATIFVASTWPELFSFEPASPVSESRQVNIQPPAQQQQTSSSTPEKRAPRTIKTEPASKETKPLISKKTRQQTPVKKPETIASTAGNYYVQTGAFKEKIRARKLANKLKEHGWNTVIVPKSGLHAVWAGPRNSRKGIETLQKNIARTLNIKGFIVQKNNS